MTEEELSKSDLPEGLGESVTDAMDATAAADATQETSGAVEPATDKAGAEAAADELETGLAEESGAQFDGSSADIDADGFGKDAPGAPSSLQEADKSQFEAVPPASGAASASKGLSVAASVILAVVALGIGLLIGVFALSGLVGAAGPAGGGSGALNGKTALAEGELDTVIGTYTYNGKSTPVTAREAILQNGSLDAAKNAEGNYTVPSADTVLSIARNAIMVEEANARGLSVNDEDLTAYAQETLGSSDFATIASSYGMDEAKVKELLTESALMGKLRDSVIGEQPDATAPEPPTEPETEEGEEPDGSVETKEYADYIIKLAGDEWDAEKDTWVSPDGPYATALSGYEISSKSASYDAASAAYYVAYQSYSEVANAGSEQWTEFVNSLLSKSSIKIDTLLS